jgi:ribosomal protein S18 acetylase RimI-like enzyme
MKVLKSSAQEYASHMRTLHRTYAIDCAQANSTTVEEEKKRTAKELRDSLPKGQKTPNEYFYTIFQEEAKIGYLWLTKPNNRRLFISNIYVFAKYRSKGFGSRIMKWIQSKAQSMNCTEVRLHVFGHNGRAIDFYDRCGYHPTNITMRKRIAKKKKRKPRR